MTKTSVNRSSEERQVTIQRPTGFSLFSDSFEIWSEPRMWTWETVARVAINEELQWAGPTRRDLVKTRLALRHRVKRSAFGPTATRSSGPTKISTSHACQPQNICLPR